MVDIQSATAVMRQGIKKKKKEDEEETTGQQYRLMACPIT